MIFGIDLGTSNSLIAYLKEGVPTVIPNALGDFLTPSVVSLEKDNTLIVGQSAKERLISHPQQTISLFKRLMGKKVVTKLGNHTFLPEELSSLVLKSLKHDAEIATGHPVHDVVISVPAYFNDQQRQATLLAGELAGLHVVRLVNEPTAAALFHGIHEQDKEVKFLVFDLGGGTFDVTILERFQGIMEVRATGGDSFLGGDDFTETMMQLLLKKIGNKESINTGNTKWNLLKFVAESAKRQLMSQEFITVHLPSSFQGAKVTIHAHEYEVACEALIDKMRQPIQRSLRDARLKVSELDEIVLVGGATRMKMIRHFVSRLFGRIPARYIDPDQTIALGAAVCAGLIDRHVAFEEMVLTDVCPHSLGINVQEITSSGESFSDIFSPIIERNTIVPASRVRTFTPSQDYQKAVNIDIYQGEARRCSENLKLGSLSIPLPHGKKTENSLDVRFTYDINGILEVDVDINKTKEKHHLLIKNLTSQLSEQEIEVRRSILAQLKMHPRDEAHHQQLLARANRLYEQTLGDVRRKIGTMISEFEISLNRQNPKEIREAAILFEKELHFIEESL